MFRFIYLVILFSMHMTSYAQLTKMEYSKIFNLFYYPEKFNFSIGIGTSGYRGDICGRPGCNTFSPSYSLGFNIKPMPIIGFGADLKYFKLQAYQHKIRQNTLIFNSSNWELTLYSRIYLFDDIVRTALDRKRGKKSVKLYVMLGITALSFNANSRYYNIVTPPLPSEKMDYPATSFSLPVGGGLTYRLSERITIVGEGIYSLAFTDYLDDIAKIRGNRKKTGNDSYVSAFIKVQIYPWIKKTNKPS